MCAAPAAVDAAATMPPRQAAAAGAEPAPRHARALSWINCMRQLATYRFHARTLHGVGQSGAGAATKKDPAGVTDPRRQAPLKRRGPRSMRPTVTVASTGLRFLSALLAAFEWQPCNLNIPRRVAACRRACGMQDRRTPYTQLASLLAICAVQTAHRPLEQCRAHSTQYARCTISHLWYTPWCTLHAVAGGPPALSYRRLPARSSSSRNLLQTARTPPPPPPSLPFFRLRPPRHAFSASRGGVRAPLLQRA